MSEFSKGFKSRRPDKSFYDPAFASGWWVYGTLILSWCLDLLPLSRLPYFPSFLILTLVFWTIQQPQRIYYWLAFAFGLLTDADTGAVFGQHALTYCMVVFFTELMSVRLSWLSSIAQSISLIPIFYIPAILLTIEAFCFGNGFGPWSIFAQDLLSVVIWPAWCWLLARRWVPNYRA